MNDDEFVELLGAVNAKCVGRAIGELQTERTKLKQMTRTHPQVFLDKPNKPASDDEGPYVYHFGGRNELQFNFGAEGHPDGDVFRHGLAFSFRKGGGQGAIQELERSVDRFDEYLERGSEVFRNHPEFKSWHWIDGKEKRVGDFAPRAIKANGLFKPGIFVMVAAKYIPMAEAKAKGCDGLAEEIVSDFDLLMPVYCYVENHLPVK